MDDPDAESQIPRGHAHSSRVPWMGLWVFGAQGPYGDDNATSHGLGRDLGRARTPATSHGSQPQCGVEMESLYKTLAINKPS